MRSRDLALTALLSSTAVVLRLSKNWALGPVQFVNIPLVFAVVAGRLVGVVGGALVGVLGFLLTDLFLGFGPWSLVDSALNGLIGSLWGVTRGRRISVPAMAALVYLSAFAYDVLSSTLLYVVFGLSLEKAFLTGLAGLFIPVYGGGLVGVGPVTEATTTVLAVAILRALEARGFQK